MGEDHGSSGAGRLCGRVGRRRRWPTWRLFSRQARDLLGGRGANAIERLSAALGTYAAQRISLATLVVGHTSGAPLAIGQDNRDLRFLGHEVALSVLPSPQILTTHRALSTSEARPGRFLGFGDPVLEGKGGPVNARSLARAVDGTTGLGDPGTLRSELAALPASRFEMEQLLSVAGQDKAEIVLGAAATETAVKAQDFGGVETLVFATHALVTGEFYNLIDPALVMTPPLLSSADDDGLLLAGEIGRLDIGARLVILSACNIGAATGRAGAPGLSGLASAFWLAGADTMLVSHWRIHSASATVMTPVFYEVISDDPDLGEAEALRRTMRGLVDKSELDFVAHPAFWGAFTVIGLG